MLKFSPLDAPAIVPGLALRLSGRDDFLRITHVFPNCVYAMWVRGAEGARYAKRPSRFSLRELSHLATRRGATWGKLALDPAQAVRLDPNSDRNLAATQDWELLQPLIKKLDDEKNLASSRFTATIRDHAKKTKTEFNKLWRLVVRYYYFGRDPAGLITLIPGVKPRNRVTDTGRSQTIVRKPLKRPGRQATIVGKKTKLSDTPTGPRVVIYPPNDFRVTAVDVQDMMKCLRRLLARGPTYLPEAYEQYMSHEFQRRHPREHEEWLNHERLEPVTLRMFRYHTQRAKLDKRLRENLKGKKRTRRYSHAHRSFGPAVVYEVDATGGRIFLVSDDDPPEELGTPIIYLIIDRWSRYVAGAYISLRPASFEELRYALLTAFTSRERFRRMGIDISDLRCPPGRPPAELGVDRGPEFTGLNFKKAAVEGFRIPVTPYPPGNPDAKAIIERFIREVKRRMASRGLKGVYADRPTDHDSKVARLKASQAAVHTILEAYRELWNVIDEHNNRLHSALKRMRILAQNGVPPIPREAYLFGLKHISALEVSPLDDDEYFRMLLGFDKAKLIDGTLFYKDRAYEPTNHSAESICESAPHKTVHKEIRVDRSNPYELYIVNKRGEWAHFTLSRGGAAELAGMTLDEEELLAERSAHLADAAERQERVHRIRKRSASSKQKRRRAAPVALDRQDKSAARARATDAFKRTLGYGPAGSAKGHPSKKPVRKETWAQQVEKERAERIMALRKRKGLE